MSINSVYTSYQTVDDSALNQKFHVIKAEWSCEQMSANLSAEEGKGSKISKSKSSDSSSLDSVTMVDNIVNTCNHDLHTIYTTSSESYNMISHHADSILKKHSELALWGPDSARRRWTNGQSSMEGHIPGMDCVAPVARTMEDQVYPKEGLQTIVMDQMPADLELAPDIRSIERAVDAWLAKLLPHVDEDSRGRKFVHIVFTPNWGTNAKVKLDDDWFTLHHPASNISSVLKKKYDALPRERCFDCANLGKISHCAQHFFDTNNFIGLLIVHKLSKASKYHNICIELRKTVLSWLHYNYPPLPSLKKTFTLELENADDSGVPPVFAPEMVKPGYFHIRSTTHGVTVENIQKFSDGRISFQVVSNKDQRFELEWILIADQKINQVKINDHIIHALDSSHTFTAKRLEDMMKAKATPLKLNKSLSQSHCRVESGTEMDGEDRLYTNYHLDNMLACAVHLQNFMEANQKISNETLRANHKSFWFSAPLGTMPSFKLECLMLASTYPHLIKNASDLLHENPLIQEFLDKIFWASMDIVNYIVEPTTIRKGLVAPPTLNRQNSAAPVRLGTISHSIGYQGR